MANKRSDAVYTEVGYEVNQASVNEAVSSATRVADVIEKVGEDTQTTSNRIRSSADVMRDLNRELGLIARERGIGYIAQDAIEAAQRTGQWAEELERVSIELADIGAKEDEIKRVARAMADAQREAGQARSSGGGGGGFLDSGDRIGSVGSQILSGLGASDAANTAGLAGDLFGAFSALNPAMLAVTAAGVGVAAVFGEINRRMEEAKEAGENYAQRTQSIAEMVASGTTSDEVRDSIDSLEAARGAVVRYNADLSAAAGELASYQRSLDDARTLRSSWVMNPELAGATTAERERALGELQAYIDGVEQLQADALQRLADRTGGTITSVEALSAAIDENRTYIDNVDTAIGDYNRAIATGMFAHNDAAAAAEDLKERFVNFVHGGIDLVRDGMDALHEVYEEQREAAQQASLKVKELAAWERERADAAREVIEQGISDAADEYLQALENVGEKQREAAAAAAEYDKAVQTNRDNLAKLAVDLATKETALNDEAQKQLLQNEDKANKELEKLEAEHRKNIAKINRDADALESNAIAARNVVALIAAQENRKKQLADEDEQYSDRKKTIDDNLREQNKVVEQRLQEQLRAARKAADDAIRLEQERGRREIDEKRRAHQQALVDLLNAQNQETLLRKQYYMLQQQESANAGVSAARAFKNAVEVELSNWKLGGFGSGGGGSSTGGKPIGSSPYSPKAANNTSLLNSIVGVFGNAGSDMGTTLLNALEAAANNLINSHSRTVKQGL